MSEMRDLDAVNRKTAVQLPPELWARILLLAVTSLEELCAISGVQRSIRELTWGTAAFKAAVLHRGENGDGRMPLSMSRNVRRFVTLSDAPQIFAALIRRGAVSKTSWPTATHFVMESHPKRTDVLRVLIANQFPIHLHTMFEAANKNRIELVRCVLSEARHLVLPGASGATVDDMLISAAVSGNNLELVTILADEFNLHVDRWSHPARRTPLIGACSNGNAAIVEALLVRGANANTHDLYGLSPLIAAFSKAIRETDGEDTVNPNSSLDIIKLLLRNGADPNLQDFHLRQKMKVPLMHVAASLGMTEVVNAIILAGHRVHPASQGFHGRSPLWEAAFSGHVDTLVTLMRWSLEDGVDVGRLDEKDFDGVDVLGCCQLRGLHDVLEILQKM